jgi:hypothetical protein
VLPAKGFGFVRIDPVRHLLAVVDHPDLTQCRRNDLYSNGGGWG